MTINFPASPNTGDTYDYNGVTYTYDGVKWTAAAGAGAAALWTRTGTALSPATAGDDVDLGTGNLSAAAGTFSGVVQVERDATGDSSVLSLVAKQGGVTQGTLRYRTAGDFLIGEDGVLASSHFAVDPQGIVRISTAGNYPSAPGIVLRPNGQGVFRNLVSDNGKNLLVQNAAGDETFFVKGNGAISSTNGSISVIASERRLKENIVSVDADTAWKTIKSVPCYAYNFVGADPSNVVYGPMADEVPAEMRVDTGRTDDVGVIHTYDNGMLQARLYVALQTALTRIEALEARLTAAGI